ncbi:hypothetical protein [uncultured Tessaracoccus sp.]|uniref:hypothetical protein n=1 Tax=uncultured Tessaracoccus sp. TaxID=905023 RepID=UPI002611CA6F|nr:hypothetical protein [uncultured Tessaracoccus sp.]
MKTTTTATLAMAVLMLTASCTATPAASPTIRTVCRHDGKLMVSVEPVNEDLRIRAVGTVNSSRQSPIFGYPDTTFERFHVTPAEPHKPVQIDVELSNGVELTTTTTCNR